MKFNLEKKEKVYLTISDTNGAIINREELPNLHPGENIVTRRLDNVAVGKMYIVTLQTETEQATVKTIIQD